MLLNKQVEFSTAKNGELTVTADSKYLHSKYNPTSEAENYVNSLQFSFSPQFIFVLEPALSYILPFLKNKYTQSSIIVIRYCSYFEKYNTGFDKVINYLNFHNDYEFENYLVSNFTDEDFFNSVYIEWKPSSLIFQAQSQNVWTVINKIIKRSHSVLATREFFEKKWLLNSIVNLTNIESFIFFKKKTGLPVFIIASGPSLKETLPFLKKNQNNIFIISASSSLSVLLYNKIIPDICISTDGGWWAGKHLKKLCSNNSIPLALSVEGFCPKSVLMQNNILLLSYPDGISSSLTTLFHKNSTQVQRNGTVSGTALSMATAFTDNDIYFCGLDLSVQKGNQHCNPNELAIDSMIQENRLSSSDKKEILSEFNPNSLQIYEDWFKKQDFGTRKIYRIIEKSEAKNSLNQIKDISIHSLEDKLNNVEETKIDIFQKESFSKIERQEFKNQIFKYIEKNISTDSFIEQLYPIESLLLHRSSENEIAIYKKQIEQKNQELLSKMRKIIYE